MIIENETIDTSRKPKKFDYSENGLVIDAMRLLKAGRLCYAYKEEQVKEICEKFKARYGIEVEVTHKDFYFILKVNKTVQKRMFF